MPYGHHYGNPLIDVLDDTGDAISILGVGSPWDDYLSGERGHFEPDVPKLRPTGKGFCPKCRVEVSCSGTCFCD